MFFAINSYFDRNQFTKMLFSFNGRLSRQDWLIGMVGWIVLLLGLIFLLNLIGSKMLLGSTMMVLYPVFIWSSFAIHVKRWHDIGRSGWEVLAYFIPGVAIFACIFLAVFPGVEGENKYGSRFFLLN